LVFDQRLSFKLAPSINSAIPFAPDDPTLAFLLKY
jgi:hypothetical protein